MIRPLKTCLLEKSREEVFRIDEDHLAPEISSDNRVPARGYGTVWIDEHVDGMGAPLDPFECFSYSVSYCMKNLEGHGHSDFRSRTLRAAKLLFGEPFDQFQSNDDLAQDDLHGHAHLEPLAGMLTVFACVEDLDAAEDLPVSVRAMGIHRFHRDYRAAFNFMSCALFGTDLNEFDMDSTSLISHCGWSVFSNIIALPDPLNTTKGLIRIQRGVLTRGGEQKRSIKDIPWRRNPFKEAEIVFLPQLPLTLNAFHVDQPSWYVGLTVTAFEVGLWLEIKEDNVQGMDQTMKGRERESITQRHGYRHFIGLTKLERTGNNAVRLAPCSHPGSALGSSYDLLPGCAISTFPLSEVCYESKEGVAFQLTGDHPITIFVSAGNRWARWLALLYVGGDQRRQRANCRTYIRHPNGCPECAMRTVKEKVEMRPDTNGADPPSAYIIL